MAVKQVISGGGAIGLKEDHTHNGKDVSHSEQQDCDEHHWLIDEGERAEGKKGMEGKSGRLESKYSEFNLGISVISKQHNTKDTGLETEGLQWSYLECLQDSEHNDPQTSKSRNLL